MNAQLAKLHPVDRFEIVKRAGDQVMSELAQIEEELLQLEVALLAGDAFGLPDSNNRAELVAMRSALLEVREKALSVEHFDSHVKSELEKVGKAGKAGKDSDIFAGFVNGLDLD